MRLFLVLFMLEKKSYALIATVSNAGLLLRGHLFAVKYDRNKKKIGLLYAIFLFLIY